MATDPDQAALTIDLGAITENHWRLRAVAAGAEVAAVVKADGYGLGAVEVASALAAAGCRTFFVAHPDEGLALRPHLEGAAIHVLHGLQGGDGAALADAGLIPVLNDPGELERWVTLARRRERRLPATLQIDTGMCRLGLGERDWQDLAEDRLAALDLGLVMSHLACAEQPDHPLNRVQQERFEALRARRPAIPASLANSSGMFLGPAFHHQLCRPGIALYGVNPTPGRPNPMLPVVTLAAPVLQLHEIDRPGSVGYGATHAVTPGMRIATVPVGYADGYLRAAGNLAQARIGDHAVPVVGRVSMDLVTVDVTRLPAEAARPGTMVELIGGEDGVERLAAAAQTIGYEVLTRLGRRFTRRHVAPGEGRTSR